MKTDDQDRAIEISLKPSEFTEAEVRKTTASEKLELDTATGEFDTALSIDGNILRLKDVYKEFMPMLKDTLDVSWRIAPIAFLPAALLLWSYLKSIHWTSLFQSSAMTGSGLIYLFVAAMLLAVATVLQFALPSAMLIGTLFHYRLDRRIPRAVARLYRWAMGGWLLGFVIIIGFDSSQAWIICALTFASAWIYALTRRDDLELRAKPNRWRHISIFYSFMFAGATMTTMCMTSVPLLLVLRITARYVDGGLLEKLIGFGVCLGTTVISLLPGYMYMNARTWKVGAYQPTKFALLGTLLLSYVVLAGALTFLPVSTTVLRLAGVYSNEMQTFEVLQPNLVSAANAAGLSLNDDGKLTLLRAYVRYDFGGTRLLCNKSFHAETVTNEAIKFARERKMPDPGIIAGAGCVQASTTELRSLRLSM
ncbi:hypothetical protein ASG35_07620 [Burkholderia sp. Leaf177]|uniref:hypothetical protein n=1 Tax=Burkholderia sp. Leaf177 TaxID=1736287 RepID=UPI0006FCA0F6|nr:hypothetical protein [Burkholderia sp. Leaf177]KQR79734.1 hypothetical protein ASG35_07620 [Burkholderia sp. Leaf177]